MWYKIIVNAPTGRQESISIRESGEYFDPSRIIWDERVDGKIPEDMIEHIGYLVRDGDSLMIDNDMKISYDSYMSQKEYDMVIESRRKEYASIDHEFLDAIAAKEAGDSIPMQDYLTKRNAIKTKYPKPS